MGHMNFFVFDGRSSVDFGAYAASVNHFDFPERVIEKVEVPGRNGSLGIDGGRFSNIELSYTVYMPGGVSEGLPGLAAFLLSSPGYRRLEDTFTPGHYRMARFVNGFKGAVSDRMGGSVEIIFDAKPQRFLLSGEDPVEFTAAGTLFNPTGYAALPLIRAHGTAGSVTVGGVTLTFAGLSSYVDIDCDLQGCYEGDVNRNGNAVMSGTSFPALAAGENGVSFTGFSKLEITPRFWTI